MLYQEQTISREVSLDQQIGAARFVPWSLQQLERQFRYSSRWRYIADEQWQDRARCPQWPYFVSSQADRMAGIPLYADQPEFQGPGHLPLAKCYFGYSYSLH